MWFDFRTNKASQNQKCPMSLWVVRAGRFGEQQETAISQSIVCHGWNELPDYASCESRDDMKAIYTKTYPSENEKRVISGMSQVWRFAKEIQIGDLVALPLKSESSIAFGRVTGEYKYKQLAQNVFHARSVEWFKTIPRSVLPEDILFSMNSSLTIFKVTRNDAEERVKKILLAPDPAAIVSKQDAADELVEEAVNLEESARDEILKFIPQNFKSHDLARLVSAVLRA